MLVAYFDESGTHGKKSRLVTVAGLIGDSTDWARIEPPWKRRLGDIACFHATDCAGSKKGFAHLSEPACALLSSDLAALIANRALVPIGASVYTDEWEYAASSEMKAQYRTPYHFCLSVAILLACQASGHGDPVAFVFAEQREYEDYSRAIHEVFSQNFEGIGSLSFAKPECVIPLQAADLYAYETYRELLTQLKTPGMSGPARPDMKTICRALRTISIFAGIEMLHKSADAMDVLKLATERTPPTA
jgi:hypothetical protein